VVKVKVKKNESFEDAFRRFNRKVQQARTLSDIKQHRYYEKPSDERRKQVKAKMRKLRRRNRY